MGVVAVNTPGGEDALSETVFTGSADVIHDLVTAIFKDRFANARGNIVKRCVPGCLFPLTFTADKECDRDPEFG